MKRVFLGFFIWSLAGCLNLRDDLDCRRPDAAEFRRCPAALENESGVVGGSEDAGTPHDVTSPMRGEDGPAPSRDAPLDMMRAGSDAGWSLTVLKNGDGVGLVEWREGTGLTCGDDCQESFDRSAVPRNIVLGAYARNGSVFDGWNGCSSTKRDADNTCIVQVDGHKSVTATFRRGDLNLAFVTSTTYLAQELGSFKGADNACNDRARAAALPGRFIALAAATLEEQRARLGTARGWLRVDRKPFMDTYDPRSFVYYPLSVTEFGAQVTEDAPTLGFPPLGGAACNNLTGEGTFAAGLPTAGTWRWLVGFDADGVLVSVPCSTRFRLYCLGADHKTELTFDRAAGRVAFVGQGNLGTGLAGADQVCMASAKSVGLEGSFKAMLASISSSAAQRFAHGPETMPWVRPDGVALVARASDLFDPNARLLSAFQVTHLGTHWPGPVRTGASDPRSVGSIVSTCSDWATTGGTQGEPTMTLVKRMFAEYPDGPCKAPSQFGAQVFCLQE